MSFRLFIYYCAMCGGAGAFVGWVIGRMTATADPNKLTYDTGIKGLFLGLGIALFLSILDSIWNFSTSRIFAIFGRVLIAVIVGAAGGLLGGIVGDLLKSKWDGFFVVGWTLTGLLIGVSVGVFDLLAAIAGNHDTRGPLRKMINGMIGGTIGGILGGIVALQFAALSDKLEFLKSKPRPDLWSPSSWGMVILGMCIGLLIGLAQVVLKEAWLKVEAGFRKGREQILSNDTLTIGRAEKCDLGLFGDNQMEKVHARIVRKGNEFILTDENTASGTYVNDERIFGSRTLRSGDLIRMGRCVLRFGERAKH